MQLTFKSLKRYIFEQCGSPAVQVCDVLAKNITNKNIIDYCRELAEKLDIDGCHTVAEKVSEWKSQLLYTLKNNQQYKTVKFVN